jgi:D-alanyl-D-alanine carboxypeptidase
MYVDGTTENTLRSDSRTRFRHESGNDRHLVGHTPHTIGADIMITPRIPNLSRTAGIVLTFVAVTATGCGTHDDRAALPTAAIAQTELDTLIADGVPGAVALTTNDHDQLTVVSGLANVDTRTAITSTDRYRIGSMTKPFTAAVVMQLVDEGTLTLDDTVEQWLPGAISNGAEITVRQLLGHTSGIPDYSDDDATVLQPYLDGDFGYVWTPNELVAIADAHGPLTPPGTEYRYSNTNYLVVGLIIEAATNRTLGDEMNTRIIQPLGLRDTTFPTTADVPSAMARGYLLGNGDPLDVTDVYPYEWAAGNLISTPADVTTFYKALVDGDLVPAALVAEMKPALNGASYAPGLGLDARQFECGVGYGFDGAIAGYRTIGYVLDNGRSVVVMANSLTMDDSVADLVADEQFDRIVTTLACP